MSLRHLSIGQISEMSNIDRRTIKKRLSGLTPRMGPNNAHLYDMHDVIPILASGNTKDAQDKAMSEAALRIEQAKCQKLEIEVGRLRGELLPIEDVAKAVSKDYGIVRASLRAIPSKLAKTLSLLSDPTEVHARLTEAVDETLSELSAEAEYERRNANHTAREQAEADSSVDVDAASETEPGSMG